MEFKTISKQDGVGAKDFTKIEAESYVSTEEYIPKQPRAISIKGNTFGSYGDYSCIVGSSKSRKTWLKSALGACYMGGEAQFYFPDIVGHDTEGKYLIDIDTEQSRWHSQWVFKRVPKMVGRNSPFYKSFCLRRYDANTRLEFIDWLITKSKYRHKIGLVMIDGYADLVNDFNSLQESNDLQQKLLSWTADYNCHITGVLHKNFNSQKPVGHVGSAVLKKAETVIFTEKDGDRTVVSCEYARNNAFEDFAFKVEKDKRTDYVLPKYDDLL